MNTKKTARRQARQVLAGARAAGGFPLPEVVLERVRALTEYVEADDLLAFFPLGTEVDVTLVIDDALSLGKRVWLPLCTEEAHKMVFLPVHGEWRKDLVRAQNGTMCPVSEEIMKPQMLGRTLVLVPGLAFDREMHRLGRGGGYYDVFLSSLPADPRFCFCGVCIEQQTEVEFPVEEHDMRVDKLVVFQD